jgi:hypothetical protein
LDLNINRPSIEKFEKSEQIVNINIRQISEKTREENIEKIRRIMLESAINQLNYENCNEDVQEENVALENNHEIEFFDF